MEMRLELTLRHFMSAALGLLWVGGVAACSSNKNGGTPQDGGGGDSTTDAGLADAVADGGAADVAADVATDAAADVADVGAEGDGPFEADTGPCTGVLCAGACVQATDCRTCSGAPLLCGATGTCVAACAGCQNSQGSAEPIDCFACDSNNQSPIGTCQPADAGSYCLSGDYLGQYEGGPGYQCGCNDVSGCPGATQVCVPLGNRDAGVCLTCGEITTGQIQGLPCKDGGTCQATAAICQ
jgi:hypothetical protein